MTDAASLPSFGLELDPATKLWFVLKDGVRIGDGYLLHEDAAQKANAMLRESREPQDTGDERLDMGEDRS